MGFHDSSMSKRSNATVRTGPLQRAGNRLSSTKWKCHLAGALYSAKDVGTARRAFSLRGSGSSFFARGSLDALRWVGLARGRGSNVEDCITRAESRPRPSRCKCIERILDQRRSSTGQRIRPLHKMYDPSISTTASSFGHLGDAVIKSERSAMRGSTQG